MRLPSCETLNASVPPWNWPACGVVHAVRLPFASYMPKIWSEVANASAPLFSASKAYTPSSPAGRSVYEPRPPSLHLRTTLGFGDWLWVPAYSVLPSADQASWFMPRSGRVLPVVGAYSVCSVSGDSTESQFAPIDWPTA